MSDLLLAPYLATSADATVGGWQLLPFASVAESEAVPEELRRPVNRLVDAYRFDGGTGLGAVVFPRERQVGAEFDRSAIRPLARALLAGSVVGNPRMAVSEDEEPANAGWGTVTSENALVYGHPLSEGHSYAIETGVLVRVGSLRHAQGNEPLPKIDPPVELPTPMFARFDAEFADATARLLNAGDATSRRLTLALDWYAVTLSNAEAVTVDVRVGGARSALEILTDSGDETKRLVRAYGELMRDDESAKNTYEDVFWAKGPVQLAEDEWWLTRLCQLRNATVHGDELDDELWHYAGHHQLNHIHDRLVAALRVVVADGVGDPHLRIAQGDRVFPHG